MPITIPDGKLVSMFEQKSSLIEQQIYKNEQQIRELSNLRDWLLPNAYEWSSHHRGLIC